MAGSFIGARSVQLCCGLGALCVMSTALPVWAQAQGQTQAGKEVPTATTVAMAVPTAAERAGAVATTAALPAVMPVNDTAARAAAGALALTAAPASDQRQPLSLRPQTSMIQRLRWSSPLQPAQEAPPEKTGRPDIRIVELPPEPVRLGPPPRRAHHAISVSLESTKQFLRGFGLDATDCAARFRMPSKLRKDASGSTSVDVMAQLGMACHF